MIYKKGLSLLLAGIIAVSSSSVLLTADEVKDVRNSGSIATNVATVKLRGGAPEWWQEGDNRQPNTPISRAEIRISPEYNCISHKKIPFVYEIFDRTAGCYLNWLGGVDYTSLGFFNEQGDKVDSIEKLGEYTLKIKGEGYYTGETEFKFVVDKVFKQSDFHVTPDVYYYTGQSITPEFQVNFVDGSLANDSDYTVMYCKGDVEYNPTGTMTYTKEVKDIGTYTAFLFANSKYGDCDPIKSIFEVVSSETAEEYEIKGLEPRNPVCYEGAHLATSEMQENNYSYFLVKGKPYIDADITPIFETSVECIREDGNHHGKHDTGDGYKPGLYKYKIWISSKCYPVVGSKEFTVEVRKYDHYLSACDAWALEGDSSVDIDWFSDLLYVDDEDYPDVKGTGPILSCPSANLNKPGDYTIVCEKANPPAIPYIASVNYNNGTLHVLSKADFNKEKVESLVEEVASLDESTLNKEIALSKYAACSGLLDFIRTFDSSEKYAFVNEVDISALKATLQKVRSWVRSSSYRDNPDCPSEITSNGTSSKPSGDNSSGSNSSTNSSVSYNHSSSSSSRSSGGSSSSSVSAPLLANSNSIIKTLIGRIGLLGQNSGSAVSSYLLPVNGKIIVHDTYFKRLVNKAVAGPKTIGQSKVEIPIDLGKGDSISFDLNKAKFSEMKKKGVNSLELTFKDAPHYIFTKDSINKINTGLKTNKDTIKFDFSTDKTNELVKQKEETYIYDKTAFKLQLNSLVPSITPEAFELLIPSTYSFYSRTDMPILLGYDDNGDYVEALEPSTVSSAGYEFTVKSNIYYVLADR